MTEDPYLEIVYEHWEDILKWYNLFAAKRPVMLYRRARRNRQMVVFVRDNEQERLVSYSLDFD